MIAICFLLGFALVVGGEAMRSIPNAIILGGILLMSLSLLITIGKNRSK